MSTVRRISGLLGKVRAPLSKISIPTSGQKDDELISAVIQRIEVDGEDHLAPVPADGHEHMYTRLMRRLDWQLKNSGITVEELVRTFPGEVRSLLLFKSYEGTKKKRKKFEFALRDKLIEMGFRSIQPGVWILPPSKTTDGLDTQDALKIWFRQRLARAAPKSVDYVFPFIAAVDLKKVVSERRGIRKMPTARTLFSVLSVEEVAPPSHVYATMRAQGHGVREVILAGDLQFLSSAFAEREDMEGIQSNEMEIGRRLRHATGAASVDLEGIANLGPETIAKAVTGYVRHPKDFAQRLIVEAQYWMRFLGGTVPA